MAQFIARRSRENVEPLGCKAFLVGVDREACALYKHAQDRFLTAGYSEVVCTGNTNDTVLLKPKLWDDVIVHELLHFLRSQHGKLWKTLMRAHLGEYKAHEIVLMQMAQDTCAAAAPNGGTSPRLRLFNTVGVGR